MGRRCLSDAEKAQARAAYRRCGTIASACRATGRSSQVVLTFLMREGLHRPRRKPKGRIIRRAGSPGIAERNEAIYRLYREGLCAKLIARRFGIEPGLVNRVNNMMRAKYGEKPRRTRRVNAPH